MVAMLLILTTLMTATAFMLTVKSIAEDNGSTSIRNYMDLIKEE